MAYAQGQTANVHYKGQPVDRPPSVSATIEGFDPVINRAGAFLERLQKLHDRIHGPRPEPVGNDTCNPIPQSLVGSINERRSRLSTIFDAMEGVIDGLESGI